MRNKSLSPQEYENNLNRVQEELLALLLEEEAAYPWDMSDPEAQRYLGELEGDFSLLDCLDERELSLNAGRLFSSLDQCWRNSSSPSAPESLLSRFGDYLPPHLLESIAQQAKEIITLNLDPVEQLIECVRPLLSNWAEEDLQIFARPLVYSLRGNHPIKQAPWEELSHVERAKLTMKVAQEALSQLQEAPVKEQEGD
jgi:hypothetical protein